MKLQLASFLFFISLAYGEDLLCYDCDPNDKGNCISPADNSIKVTNCLDKLERTQTTSSYVTQKIPAREQECFVMYLNGTDIDSTYKPGFYRDCISKNTGEQACDEIRRKFKGVARCTSCPETRCNTDNFGSEPGQPDGSVAITVSAAILSFGVLFLRVF